MTQHWAILTGEYPPQPGGVSNYTELVAEALAAAGDRVSVYAPPAAPSTSGGVEVRRLPDHFGPRGLAWLDAELGRVRPSRILIQYVPHAFGMRALNLPFAAWVAARAARHAPVWAMFHEVAFPFVRRPRRHNLLALGTRLMARLVAAASERVFVSIPAWRDLLRRIAPRAARAEWLPIPSNVPTRAAPGAVAAVRARFAPRGLLAGHFGTFGPLITDLLGPAACSFLDRRPGLDLLLIGRNSERFRDVLASAHPDLASRLHAAGELPADELPGYLRACDLLLQPFPDGVSSRRTSIMAALANGVPVVSNLGALSEPLWASANCLGLAVGPDSGQIAAVALDLLTRPDTLAEVGTRGAALYNETFALERVIERLRGRP